MTQEKKYIQEQKHKIDEIYQKIDVFTQIKVLVIGDIMIDAYQFGKIDRISPEAPVPVFVPEKEEKRLGGAANVVQNLIGLGAQVFLASVIGGDQNGKILQQLFPATLNASLVVDPQRKTTCKTRLIAQGQQILRIDEEDTADIHPDTALHLLERIKNFCYQQKIDVVILQDYNKGLFTENFIRELLRFFKEKNIKVAVDPKKKNFLMYQNVDLFKPNLKELKEALDEHQPTRTLADFLNLIKHLEQKIHPKNTLLTLSEHGILMKTPTHHHYFPAADIDVVDVSGAGDTVISLAALALAAGFSPDEIAEWSNLAGGWACGKMGVVAITAGDLKKMLKDKKIHALA